MSWFCADECLHSHVDLPAEIANQQTFQQNFCDSVQNQNTIYPWWICVRLTSSC